MKEPVDYVDPLMGTTIPQWTLFPGATTPSGMVKISPDNQVNGWEAGYDYKIESIAGFSHIHSRTMGGLPGHACHRRTEDDTRQTHGARLRLPFTLQP
ncbi:MAG: hypothetical protein IPI37_06575 [Bacteroidales bacterium]|nr:hypothetical protein [Bacteroidales bacterium]